ncbi:MAG: DUF2937 family protein [Pseudomonadota bacterium]
MILRTVVLASGLSGALLAAQFPAYSDQYIQRLGGAVDALQQVVADFDHSAETQGLTRDDALAQMRGSPFLEARRVDMSRTFKRHARLKADLSALEGLGPFMRAYHFGRLTDPEIARRALGTFQPSLPLSFVSALFAIAGFLLTATAVKALAALLRGRRPMPA